MCNTISIDIPARFTAELLCKTHVQPYVYMECNVTQWKCNEMQCNALLSNVCQCIYTTLKYTSEHLRTLLL